ncbi:MAG: extracellular solute-binding protein [Anaerolineae bacterium]|nr:extracellular solute-binding protein [Anaerolineae bacterium]
MSSLTNQVSRRRFLRSAGLAAGATVLAACATPTPQVIEKVVKETVVIEKEKPVEKVVKETVVVEKEKPVEKIVKETVVVKETAAPAPVTVTVLMYGQLLTEADALGEGMLYTVHLMEFNLKQKNIIAKYEAWPGGDDYNSKVRLMTSSGELKDHVIWLNWQSTRQAVMDKLLLPLDDLMAAKKVSKDEWISAAQFLMRYDPKTNKEGEGPFYTLPIAANAGLCMMYLNLDMIEGAGQQPPTSESTWKDIETVATKIAKPGQNIYGMHYNPWGTTHGLSWDYAYVAPFGGAILDKEGKKALINSPESVNAFAWYWDIHQTRKLAPDAAGYKAIGDYKQGTEKSKLAMYRMGGWGGGWFLMRPKNEGPKMGFTVSPATYDKGINGRRGNDLSLNLHGISANAKNPAAAFDVLYWLTNKEAGIQQAKAGNQLPYPRPDVLKDAVMKEKPHLAQIAIAVEGAEILPRVANGRDNEVGQVLGQKMVAIDSGEQKPDKAFLDMIAAEIQKILDMPPAAG